MSVRSFFLMAGLLLLSTAANAATQRALLIGISNYEANLPPLAGSRNDVTLIRELLIYKYGFDRSNIQVIVDEQATRQKIFAAIDNLSKQSGPEDIVLIHFSGHGSQAPDTNGDEPDGFDETILPHDSRTPGIPDITDDEINMLISRFSSRSVVVILDSCHSGTGTRSGPTLVSQRWVAPDTRKELYQAVSTRQVVTLPVSENHVFFAAAQEFESELDGPFGPDDMRLGLFTAAMVGVLANSQPDITPRQAIEGVNARVEALKASAAGMPIPEPNMEAPQEKHDQPMFVFTDSAVKTEAQPAPVPFAAGDQSPPGSSRAVFVTMNGSPQPETAEEIAASIGSNVVIAETLQAADAVVDVVGEGVYDVYGPGGTVIVARGLRSENADADEDSFEFLESIVLNAPTLARLVSLTTPPSGMQMTLKAAGAPVVRSSKVSTRTVKVSVNTASHKLEFYRPGQPRTRANSLQLEALSNQDCYLTIASLNSAGEVYLLLPNAGQEYSGFLGEGLVPADQPVLIPDSLAPGNDAGFYFDYAPPGGTDRVIGICMANLEAAQRLREQLTRLENRETVSDGLFATRERGLTGITPGPGDPQLTTSNLDRPEGGGRPEPNPAQPKPSRWAASILTLEVGS